MTTDVTLVLQNVMDYCNDRWAEADRPTNATWPTPDMLTGKKMAYHDLLQFARRLLVELSDPP